MPRKKDIIFIKAKVRAKPLTLVTKEDIGLIAIQLVY